MNASTAKKENIKRAGQERCGVSFSLTLGATALLMAAALLFPAVLADGVRAGLELSLHVVIPTLFPFFILSDFLLSVADFRTFRRIGHLFSRLFAVRPAGISACLAGMLCGFPLGAMTAIGLYRRGELGREETERLIGFSNNTGAAFLIAGVGVGLRGSAAEGAILYGANLLSALLVGVLFSHGRVRAREEPIEKERESVASAPFSLTDSIRRAGERAVTVTAFLLFFSVLNALLASWCRSEFLLSLLTPLLEVGNAASVLARSDLPRRISLALTACAVGFSGLSVHCQTLDLLRGTDLSPRLYFRMKSVQGILAGGIILLLPTQIL